MTAPESLLVCSYILVFVSGMGLALTVVNTIFDWLDSAKP
jgi:hypothetical protein